MKRRNILFVLLISGISCKAQTLQEMINMAQTKSLDAAYVFHKQKKAEWVYKYYKAEQLPVLTLTTTPFQYNSDVVERYSYDEDRTVYRAQQYLYSSANLMMKQNVDFLGGYFYIESNLLHNKSLQNSIDQYTSVPFRFGYNQNLLGYNPYKWTKRIEHINYSISKKEQSAEKEQIAIETITRFFQIISLSEQLKLARTKYAACDSLYRVGVYKKSLGKISANDLYELKIEMIHAQIEIFETEASVIAENKSLANYLQLEDTTSFHFIVPTHVPEIEVPLDVAIEQALINSVSLDEYQKAKLLKKQTMAQMKAQKFGNASVSINVGWHQVSEKFQDVYNNLLNEQSIAINLTFPLADFGRKKAQLAQMRESVALDEINEQKTINSIIDEIQKRISYMPIYYLKIGSANETMILTGMMYDEALKSYTLGRSTFANVSNAIVRQKTALVDYYYAIRDYWINYYEIRRLTCFDFENGGIAPRE